MNLLPIAIIAVLIATFSIADCMSAPLLETYGRGRDTMTPFIVNGVVYGIAIAQINLIAIWTGLGSGNFVQRLCWLLLLIVWTWYGYVVGLCWWVNSFGLNGPTSSLRMAVEMG